MSAKLLVQCEICKTPLEVYWADIAGVKANFCPNCKKYANRVKRESSMEQKFGTGYFTAIAPQRCFKKGIMNCLNCPLPKSHCHGGGDKLERRF